MLPCLSHERLNHDQLIALLVSHIMLIDCVDFIEFRNRHFNVNGFFEKDPSDSVYLIYMRLVCITVCETS